MIIRQCILSQFISPWKGSEDKKFPTFGTEKGVFHEEFDLFTLKILVLEG